MEQSHLAFMGWIRERHNIYLNRAAGLPRPWTTDPILERGKFCNAYRQLDRTTQWLNENWFPGIPDSVLPFWTVVSRLLNHPPALEVVRPDSWMSWDPTRFELALFEHHAKGGRYRTAAYRVTSRGGGEFPTFQAHRVLTPMWQSPLLEPADTSLEEYCAQLRKAYGVGGFIAGQLIADLKYWHPVCKAAPDWWDFVVPGPGSTRGLNRLLDRDPRTPMAENLFHRHVPLAIDLANDVTRVEGWDELHAQDVQNCLCEFDKYERAREGTGNLRRFKPNLSAVSARTGV